MSARESLRYRYDAPARQYGAVSAILYPIAADPETALTAPLGRAAREREAERLSGAPVRFVRELTGPVFRSEAEARAHYPGRLDDDRPDRRVNLPAEDRFCELKAIVQRSRVPFAPPHTAWRLAVAYWRAGESARTAVDAPQARKVRRQKAGLAPDAETLEAIASQPLLPIRPQRPLDIGLFEVRLPEAPHIVVPDE
jgi:hypothetical protein